MEKTTVLAKLRVSMKFSEEAQDWLREVSKKDIWFTKEAGTPFFLEFRGWWKKALISSSEPIICEYFLGLGLPEDKLPHIELYETYPGSWNMDASLVIVGAVGMAYKILKGLSELPKIADGLMKLRDRLKQAFTKEANQKATEALTTQVKQNNLPSPPSNPIRTDYVIDARPIVALTSVTSSHGLHMSVAVTRGALTLENLGDEPLRDIRIGIFKSNSPQNEWRYADSYMGEVAMLSSKQTITKELADFRDSDDIPLDLSDDIPFYVDCWIQDIHGIYLFIFYLEKENPKEQRRGRP